LPLNEDYALFPTEFKYPIQARAARSESVPVRNDHQANQILVTSRNHIADGVYLGMNIMTPKSMLNVASNPSRSGARQGSTAYFCSSDNT